MKDPCGMFFLDFFSFGYCFFNSTSVPSQHRDPRRHDHYPKWPARKSRSHTVPDRRTDGQTDRQTDGEFISSIQLSSSRSVFQLLSHYFMVLCSTGEQKKPQSQTLPNSGWISSSTPKILHFLCAEMEISILTQSKNMINCSLPESRREGSNKPDWSSFSFQAIQLCRCYTLP